MQFRNRFEKTQTQCGDRLDQMLGIVQNQEEGSTVSEHVAELFDRVHICLRKDCERLNRRFGNPLRVGQLGQWNEDADVWHLSCRLDGQTCLPDPARAGEDHKAILYKQFEKLPPLFLTPEE